MTVEAGGMFEGPLEQLRRHPPCAQVRTDGTGPLHVAEIPPNEIVTMVAEAPSLQTAGVAVRDVGATGRPGWVVTRLPTDCRVAGLVHDPDGRP